MKKILLLLFSIFSLKAFAQCRFNENDSDIVRLKQIAVNLFIKTADNPGSKTHQKIQEIFEDVRTNGRARDKEDYGDTINAKLIKTSVADFYLYHTIGAASDPAFNGTSRTQGLTLFIIIPYYDGIAMGYGISSIIFLVNLEQLDKWDEDGDDKIAPEKKEGYKVKYTLTRIKFIDTN